MKIINKSDEFVQINQLEMGDTYKNKQGKIKMVGKKCSGEVYAVSLEAGVITFLGNSWDDPDLAAIEVRPVQVVAEVKDS